MLGHILQETHAALRLNKAKAEMLQKGQWVENNS